MSLQFLNTVARYNSTASGPTYVVGYPRQWMGNIQYGVTLVFSIHFMPYNARQEAGLCQDRLLYQRRFWLSGQAQACDDTLRVVESNSVTS
jgi:hypothetical protein